MKISKIIEEDIDINWNKVYNIVKKDYDKWIQYNIDHNINPLNQSFDYDIEELSEYFDDNASEYLKEYIGDTDIDDYNFLEEFYNFLKSLEK